MWAHQSRSALKIVSSLDYSGFLTRRVVTVGSVRRRNKNNTIALLGLKGISQKKESYWCACNNSSSLQNFHFANFVFYCETI